MKRFYRNMTSCLTSHVILFFGLVVSAESRAQVKYQSKGPVHITIQGTSNIHDWDLKSDKGVCSAEFLFTPGGYIGGLTTLQFTLPAESLKSDNKTMDKNTYKALNTAKYNAFSPNGE
jgi:hypothetical protein